jgi:flagellar biosynthetic protein FlhB
MAEGEDDGKTEEPTEKKIAEALDSGNIPVSRDVSLLTGLAALLILETLVLPRTTSELTSILLHFIDDPSGWRLEQAADASQLAGIVAMAAGKFILPVVLLFVAFGVGGHVAQNVPRFILTRIQPDLSRLSIRSGLGRMFGARGLTEFAKSLVKLGAVGVVAGLIASSERATVLTAMFAEAADLPQRLLSMCVKITAAVTIFVLVIASADLVWARIHWRRDLRMSRQDLKDEMRQAEGDRMMKARFRSLRLSRNRKRMLNAVPKATMVVVNPTHYAVALRYVRGEAAAPLVLAKGVDLIALKIREIAEEHQIPIIEDKPLARSLHDAVQVDAALPPEFYRAIAEIVHMLQGKRDSWSSSRRRIN